MTKWWPIRHNGTPDGDSREDFYSLMKEREGLFCTHRFTASLRKGSCQEITGYAGLGKRMRFCLRVQICS